MSNVNEPRSEVADSPSGEGEVRHTPSLRAEIFLFSLRGWEEEAEELVTDRITTRSYTDYRTFIEALSGKVAVVVIDATVGDEKLREAIVRAIQESAHARIALFATDGAQLLSCEVPHDEAFVFPEEQETFDSEIKRLYVRSYYSATLERYYKVCLSLRTRKVQLPEKEYETSEELQRLRRAMAVLRSHLKQFRRGLKAEDIEAMSNREGRLESLAKRSKNKSSPDAVGLPDACPKCGLDWTEWHGSRLRNGYERIGANTWRCTKCGTIMADNDPDNYRLA